MKYVFSASGYDTWINSNAKTLTGAKRECSSFFNKAVDKTMYVAEVNETSQGTAYVILSRRYGFENWKDIK